MNNKNGKSGKSIKILLISSDISADEIQSALPNLNCLVDIADHEEQTLTLYKKNNYELIFIDLQLSKNVGFDIVKKIRVEEKKLNRKRVPIAGLSAAVTLPTRQKSILAGIDTVLARPILQDKVSKMVHEYVLIHEENQEIEIPILKIEGDIIDWASGNAFSNGNQERIIKMIRMLIKGFSEDLPLITKAKTENDWEMIRKFAHKYRGGSAFCGAVRFRQASENLEEYLSNSSIDLRDELYQQFIDEYQKISKIEKNL